MNQGDKMSTEKLMNIVVDPNIQVREVEPHTVSKYSQAMREGAKFPPLVLEEDTNRVICGNHRYFAYKRVFDPSHKIEVEYVVFENEASLIRYAAGDNARHGRPMDTWDMKRVAIRLKELGDSPEEIAKTLSVPVKKIGEWAGMTVVVIGNKGKSQYTAPIKHGLEHIAGTRVMENDYNNHKNFDPGRPVKNMASVISRHIQNGWVNKDDARTMENLSQLYNDLKGLFERRAA